jgi:Raf kinase inhibitor-like YbhB/YbcL family protein
MRAFIVLVLCTIGLEAATMKLTSPAFKQGEKIPSKFTCDGKNINPELEISDVPGDAKSLVLIMDDPDVPTSVRKDRMWVHWVVYDMPPTTKTLREASEAPGTTGKNTAGELGYMGPCPPDREHRYFFKLYALDRLLKLSQGATKEQVEKAMKNHILTSTELMGRYERSKN